MTVHFALNPALDRAELAKQFAVNGQISISKFLADESASALGAALAAREDWSWAISVGNSVFDIDAKAQAAMSAEQLSALDRRIADAARDGFQFRFSSIRVPDSASARRPEDDIIHRFAEFMGSEPVLQFFRAVSGNETIRFADAQATAYHPGDFLTRHDDAVAGKDRELAYVMGLTPTWRAEWGGLLLFHKGDGRVSGLVPLFNCLNLFAIPTDHSVSQVTRFAGAVRYSVTGWFRSAIPD